MDETTLYKYQIREFSKAAPRDGSKLQILGDDFFLRGTGIKCYLFFRPISSTDKDWSSLFLHVRDFDNETSITMEFMMWIENASGRKLSNDKFSEVTFTPEGTNWGRTKFVQHADLYPPESTFAEHDTIFLCCKIRRLTPGPGEDDSMQRDAQILEKLRQVHEQQLSDDCVVEVGERRFKVHKSVLMANSEVFERMLMPEMKEGREGIVKIDGVRPEVMDSFIRYLYRGTFDEQDAMIEDLYVLSDRFMVSALKAKCSKALSNNLAPGNIFKRLVLAFTHNDPLLKQSILDYIGDGHFRNILKSSEWVELLVTNKTLTDEIVDAVFKQGMT